MAENTEISDQEYVENLVKPIVDQPAEVVTTRTLDERGVLIQLTVHRDDMGKVIGRGGKNINAMRQLLRVFGARTNASIKLKLIDPEGGEVSVPEDKPETTDAAMSGQVTSVI